MSKNEDFWIKAEIAELSRLERRGYRQRKRYGFYRFLEAVIDYAFDLERQGSLKATGRRIARISGQRSKKADPLRTIINASSVADKKTRSKWGRALRCAFDRREYWRSKISLEKFFHQNGGVAGCARKVAVRRHRFPRGTKLRDWV